ncbi:MAG: hypothetical protein A2W35_01980 [Chloroflexi bacterium RBG_16_57_11]|nr:MAG: hypothetical protein A2W35_01980 [Chloroflexi bacterium RBG_16_57_11]
MHSFHKVLWKIRLSIILEADDDPCLLGCQLQRIFRAAAVGVLALSGRHKVRAAGIGHSLDKGQESCFIRLSLQDGNGWVDVVYLSQIGYLFGLLA